jgi:hypothetical protein
MSVGCVAEVVTDVVPEIVEAIIKHEGILHKLLKSLKRCLCSKGSSSGSEGVNEEALDQLIQDTVNEMDKLCETAGDIWNTKDRRTWHKLAKKLVQYGYWEKCVATDTPWTSVCVTKPKTE